MAKDRRGILIAVLAVIVLILLGIVLYAFVIKPAIDGYITQKQIEAKDIVLSAMIAQIQQQGYTQISDVSGNAIVLVPMPKQSATQ